MKQLLLLTVILGAAALVGWGYLFLRPHPSASTQPVKFQVAATIYPVFDILRQVAGDEIGVEVIIPPGASPHTFEPSPKDLEVIHRSQRIFIIGSGLDDWIQPLVETSTTDKVVALDRNIDLLSGENGTTDPHYWLSLPQAIIIAQTIADELSQVDPQNQDTYQQNALTFGQKADQLYREYLERIPAAGITSIATFHDSWQYLANDYGLNIAATFESSAGLDPTPRELQSLQQTLATQGLSVIYAEPQFSSQKIEALARDAGLTIAYLDPLGGSLSKDTYLQLMRTNLEQIVAPSND